MSTEPRSCRRYRIRGRVQGVGFRNFVSREANLRGLVGWVRNRRDGTVEVCVWAPSDDLVSFEQAIARGPRWGRVDGLEQLETEPPETRPDGFVIRPTA